TVAAYINTPTSLGLASGKAFANKAASVLAGENSDTLITFAFPTSIASAMVSPSARPNASTIPPKVPLDAVGRVTAKIASQRVAPSPYAAILSRVGTASNEPRPIAVIVGRIMIESTITAGSIPGPLRFVPKRGIQPKSACNQ